MADYRVVVTSRAERDADGIYAWLACRAPQGRGNGMRRFAGCSARWRRIPGGTRRAPEAAALGLDIKQALFRTRYGHTFRALYTQVSDIVHVIAVRGAGEDFVTLDDVELPP